ncbi:SusD/RagB family nutrient-binding outer membrane lipoprotein [Prolixibacteraceae bacterium JC049]|nr:SusD/RagB family nutrient-binding outer membrane lipoprotein [Prolixibacteraceae bacterium JC049]
MVIGMRNTFIHIRKQFLSSLYLVSLCCVVLVGCTGGLEDLNENPNGLDKISPGQQFTTIQLHYAGTAHEVWRGNLIYASTIVKHTSSRYSEGQGFRMLHTYNDAQWDVNYRSLIKNIEDLLFNLNKDNSEGKNDNLIAATRVMRVLSYQRLTDMYGNIPYSEAGKGFHDRLFLPKYDTQEFIYKDMIKELSEASKQFKEGQKTFESQDLIYKGDISKWRRLTNSVKLRLGMRLTKIDNELAAKTVADALSEGVFEGEGDNAIVNHVLSGGAWSVHENSFGSVINRLAGGDAWSYLSDFMVKNLKRNKDIRLFYWGEVVNESYEHITLENYAPFALQSEKGEAWKDVAIVGMPSSDLSDGLRGKYFLKDDKGNLTLQNYDYRVTQSNEKLTSNFNNSYFRVNQHCVGSRVAPTGVMTFDEVQLLKTEAKLRGMVAAQGAEEDFVSGLQAAFEKLKDYPNQEIVNKDIQKAGLSGSDYVSDYLNRKRTQWGQSTLQERLEMVGEEKWKAFFPNGIEAFAEWRRSGFPKELNEQEKATRTLNIYAEGDLETVVDTKAVEAHRGGDTNYQRIRRLVYPSSELSINRDNVQQAITEMGGDKLITRVWWDKEK